MTSGTYPQLIVAQLLFTKTHTGSKIKNTFLVHYIYIIVTDMGRGAISVTIVFTALKIRI